MKKQVKLNEAQLRNMVAGCVKKALKEFISPVQPATDYEGNDLNYEHLFDDALKVIDEMNDGVTEIRWQDVAQRMGYHLDTLNEEDMELLHDAIEDAMAVPGIEEEPIHVNETKIAKIVAESVRRVLKEYGGTPQTLGSVAQNVSRRTDQMIGDYPTAEFEGQEYTIDDELPQNAKVMVHLRGSFYAFQFYPNHGESLRDCLEQKGCMGDLVEWWMEH